MKDALVIYNALSPEAAVLAGQLSELLDTNQPPCPADGAEVPLLSLPSIAITVGGDGTILRAARLAAPHGVPLLGVNLGHLGFLTEIEGSNALEIVPRYLEMGFTWIQERSMLRAEIIDRDSGKPLSDPERTGTVDALNDIVVSRAPMSRLAGIRVRVDDVQLATYSADAVIVASATGSTGYALSAGGPILYPGSSDMILKAVAPHGDLASAVLISNQSTIELSDDSDGHRLIIADGHWGRELSKGQAIRVSLSPHKAKFLRAGGASRFYETLLYRLHRRPSPPSPMSEHESEVFGT